MKLITKEVYTEWHCAHEEMARWFIVSILGESARVQKQQRDIKKHSYCFQQKGDIFLQRNGLGQNATEAPKSNSFGHVFKDASTLKSGQPSKIFKNKLKQKKVQSLSQ